MKSLRFALTLSATAVLAVGAAACGDDDNGAGGGDGLSGTISIDGSSTVAPLSTAAAEQFQAENPDVRVTVGTSGTGGGFEKFCNGETDISDASRPIKEEEIQACEANGVEYSEIRVASDGLAVIINPENDFATCLTTDQLQQIWDRGSNVSNWSDVEGIDEDEAMELFGPGTDSGTFDFFTEAINGEEGRQRTDYNNVGEDDNQTVRGVGGNLGGIGYAGLSFVQENEGTVKAAEVDGGGGCVAPSVETVQDDTYTPLSRPLFIYPSAEALQRPEVQELVRYYIDNSQSIAEQALYVPLTDEQKAAAEARVDELVGAGGAANEETTTTG